MFSRLRWRLTLLFLLAGVLLTALIAGGVYSLLRYSFQAATDEALQRKVELGAIGLQVQASPQPTPPPTRAVSGESEDSEDGGVAAPAAGGEDSGAAATGENGEERYDAELAPIFLVPLDSAGRIVGSSGSTAPPLAPDPAGIRAAATTGSDWRTLVQPDGTAYRLLTRMVQTSAGPVYLQAGRSLADQQHILQQLVLWIAGLSAVIILFLGWGSWWLAGRSLGPAQDAWERQQAFVANASHELRTPLTLLRASAEVAQRKIPASSPSIALLDDVLRETDHMAGVVEDLLLLSRLDAGALPMDIEPVDVESLFAGLASSAARLAEERGIAVAFEAGSARASADRARLRQVLLILVDNALRHTSAGGWVRVQARQDARTVQITVRDSGSGIAPEHLPHVFERFYRADPDRSAGSGLGLPIARGIILAMRGEIHLASSLGEGTTVTVTLPMAMDVPVLRSQGT